MFKDDKVVFSELKENKQTKKQTAAFETQTEAF